MDILAPLRRGYDRDVLDSVSIEVHRMLFEAATGIHPRLAGLLNADFLDVGVIEPLRDRL